MSSEQPSEPLKKALERFAEVERELTPPQGVRKPTIEPGTERILSLREEEELQARREEEERIRKFHGIYPEGHEVPKRFDEVRRERAKSKQS